MKIAVIGSGIAGLSSAWLLSQRHDVKVFEKSAHIGGHSNTRTVKLPEGDVPVDTGFIIYNETNYPNLTALFDYLDVETTASKMSFSYSLDKGRYEYCGAGLRGLFGQKTNLINPGHWRMIRDIVRFFKDATTRIVSHPDDVRLDDFLRSEGYSKSFVNDHILPMAGAIWSAPDETIKKFPARSFVDFYANHGLLQRRNRPYWRSVLGGSRQYVSKLLEDANFEIETNRPVRSVTRFASHVEIKLFNGRTETFDQVVFACHGDETHALISDADGVEKKILEGFTYSKNRAVLHTDRSQMPVRKKLWSSWNYLANRDRQGADSQMSVSYWMNSLQHLETDTDLFVTINPASPIDPAKVHYQVDYSHPVIDTNAARSQKEIWDIQGMKRTWYCGSYLGFGFHEDGLQSGLAVAEQLGGLRRPWNVDNESGRIHVKRQHLLEAAE